MAMSLNRKMKLQRHVKTLCFVLYYSGEWFLNCDSFARQEPILRTDREKTRSIFICGGENKFLFLRISMIHSNKLFLINITLSGNV